VTATAGTVLCAYCGNGPAAEATFRQHTGMVLWMKTEAARGPFCRDCGFFSFRASQAHTLLLGWWGVLSLVIAPILLIRNLRDRRRIAALGPVVAASGRPPANPGFPLYQRPAILGMFLPLLVAGFVTFTIFDGQAENQIGRCVDIADNQVDAEFVICSGRHDGKVSTVVDRADQCPPDSIGAVSRNAAGGVNMDRGRVLCIAPDS
jgi:hypothetical protein